MIEKTRAGYEEVKPLKSYWQPIVKDDEIEGEVTNIDTKDYGIQIEITDKEKNIWITPSHKELQNRLENIGLGDHLLILYRGNKPTTKGNPLELYLVYKKVSPNNFEGVKTK